MVFIKLSLILLLCLVVKSSAGNCDFKRLRGCNVEGDLKGFIDKMFVGVKVEEKAKKEDPVYEAQRALEEELEIMKVQQRQKEQQQRLQQQQQQQQHQQQQQQQQEQQEPQKQQNDKSLDDETLKTSVERLRKLPLWKLYVLRNDLKELIGMTAYD